MRILLVILLLTVGLGAFKYGTAYGFALGKNDPPNCHNASASSVDSNGEKFCYYNKGAGYVTVKKAVK